VSFSLWFPLVFLFSKFFLIMASVTSSLVTEIQ
jgi:hypothetical protein